MIIGPQLFLFTTNYSPSLPVCNITFVAKLWY